MNLPRVTSVRNQGDTVVFEFDDGHSALFQPGYYHEEIAGLYSFTLMIGATVVAMYRGQAASAFPDEHCDQLREAASGYPLDRIASYWQAASEYVKEHYSDKPAGKRDRRLFRAWLVVSQGDQYLGALQEGRAQLQPTRPFGSGELRQPDDWADEFDCVTTKREGWSDGTSWYTPITRADYEDRRSRSTTKRR